ncbi:MAG TPA: citrate/2-methylcitrate synthase, partial [Acidimicrobiales bacterium]
MRAVTAEEAAARLGVKRQTLYAYVSRGMLDSERGPDGRSSLFSAAQVEALAGRTRRGGRAGALEVVVASGLTLIDDDHLFYRGRSATGLAAGTPLEAVAEWLWTGDASVLDDPPAWPAASPSAARPPPPGVDVVNRLRITVAAAAAGDDLRYDLEPASVVAAGRRLMTAMVDGLPLLGEEPAREGRFPLAGRLWPRLAATPGRRSLVATLNAALVLLADHELAASTLAARVAASVRADPYSVVSTGLGVIAGGLHGAASRPVVDLFEEIGEAGRA